MPNLKRARASPAFAGRRAIWSSTPDMPPTPTTIERPQRWDAAFDPDMTDAALDRLLATPPFNAMNPEKFPKRTPLREILRNDARICRFRKGEIVTRQG